MKVRELMTGALVTVRPDHPVFDAKKAMQEKRIRRSSYGDARPGTPAFVAA